MMYQGFPFDPDQPKKDMSEANVSQKLHKKNFAKLLLKAFSSC